MINSTTSTDRTAHAEALAAPGPATPKPIQRRPDQLSTDSANFLREALSRQPEIRPEVLARAQALATDPKYPTPETLKQVGAMILKSPDLSEDHS